MARTVILEETTKSGFVLNDAFDAYWTMEEKPSWVLVAGQEYIVVWDGEEFICTAKAFTRDGDECVYVGNSVAEGGTMSEEPFVIVYDVTNGFGHFLSTEMDSAHTIAIYQDTSVRIVLKDRDGNDVAYEGVVEVKLPTSDGGSKSFLSVSRVKKTIEPDFSEGNVVVTPETGTLFSQVTVQKPGTLIAENIAEGVDIAGVVGAFKGGGGVELDGDIVPYLAYQLDEENKEFIVCGVLYAKLYEETGSYDVTIPDKIGAYDVVIYSLGVG